MSTLNCRMQIQVGCSLRLGITGAAAICCILTWGSSIEAVLNLIFLLILFQSASEDIKYRIIPDRYPAMLALLAAVSYIIACADKITGFAAMAADRIAGAMLTGIIMLVISLVKKKSFGGGDIKLMAAGGLFLGTSGIFIAAVCSVVISGAAVIIKVLKVMKRGHQDMHRDIFKEGIPFAPYIAAGMTMALFWGDAIWKWYIY